VNFGSNLQATSPWWLGNMAMVTKADTAAVPPQSHFSPWRDRLKPWRGDMLLHFAIQR